MASYNSGPIVFKVTTEGLVQAAAAAQSVNKDMTAAAAAAGRMGKAASGALKQSQSGLFAENRDYGQARGVTGMTGASGRDFAKQAEGLGGLVRLYATFAANIFAVSMAFEALKRSFQFEQLQRASDAFAVTTGKNLSYVAQQMKELSQGSLTDKAAQSYANYGASAGFTADQMKRLVAVAKGASQALGRDMGDSIDRLIRGTGKLEPELLDELGLLTRTKQAGIEYGKAIGKTFEQLTQFEKTQAFVNAVLKEGEQKFGAVAAAVNVSPFEKLQAAVVNAGTAILNVLNKAIAPLADFLANNSGALYGGIIAAILYLAKTALPMLNKASDEANLKAIANSKKELEYHQTKRADLAEQMKIQQQYASTTTRQYDEQIAAYRKEADSYIKEMTRKMDANSALRKATAQSGFTSQTQFGKDNLNSEQYLTQLRDKQIKLARDLEGVDAKRSAQAELLAARYDKQVSAARNLHVVEQNLVELEKERANEMAVVKQAEAELARLKKVSAAEQKAFVTDLKKSALINIGSTTQMDGVRAGFAAFKSEFSGIKAAAAEAGTSISKFGMLGFTASSMVKIGINGIIGSMGKLMAAFGWISFAIVMFETLASAFGGFNKGIDKLIESQTAFDKVLQNSAGQIGMFQKMAAGIDGTTASFSKLKEYSGNVLTGIAEGISEISKAFNTFNNESGAVTAVKERALKIFDADATTKQAEQLKVSIITALSTVTPEDKKKVETAVLSAIPSAKSVNDALSIIGSSSANALATIGNSLAVSFAQLDSTLKNQNSTLKLAKESWKNLGDEMTKLGEKEVVKNPKLKGVAEALDGIIKSLKDADATKAQEIFASISEDNLVQLLALGEKYKVNMDDLTASVYAARDAELQRAAAIKAAAAEEEAAAAKRASRVMAGIDPFNRLGTRQDQFNTADSNLDAVNITPDAAKKVLKDMADEREALLDLKKDLLSAKQFKEDPAAAAAAAKSIDTILTAMEDRIIYRQKTMLERFADFGKSIPGAITIGMAPLENKIVESPYKTKDDGRPQRMPGATAAEIEAYQNKNGKTKTAESSLEALYNKLINAKSGQGPSAKLSKEYEYTLQLLKTQLAIIKEISSIQQDLIGYVTAETRARSEAYGYAIAQATYLKQIAELDNSDKKASGDKEGAAAATKEANKQARLIAEQQREEGNRVVLLERLRNDIAAEKTKKEQEYYYYLEESLKVQGMIVSFAKEYNLISAADSTIASASLAAEKELLTVQKQRELQELKIAQIKDAMVKAQGMGDTKTATELAAMLNSSQAALANQEKQRALTEIRIKLEQQLTTELAKQKQMWDQMAAVGEALSSIVEFQLSTQSEIIGYGQVNLANAQQEAILIMTSTKALREKLTLLGLSADSEEGQVIALSEQLKITQQIYDNRRKIWELASKDDSGADFGKTLAQGFQYAVEDFRKNMRSAIGSIIDATMSGIDASVDYIIKNLKDGVQSTLKGMAKAFGQTAKDVLIQYIGDKVKLAMKQIIANMFEDKSNSLEEINKKVAESMSIANKTLQDVDNTNKQLIDALRSLEQSIRNSISNIGKTEQVLGFESAGQMDQDLASMSVSTKALIADIDNSADSFDSLGYASVTTSEAVTLAGSSMVNSAGVFANVVGSSLGYIKNALGSFGGKIGGAAGAAIDGLSGMTNMMGSVMSIGTNATTAIGMLGSASSWAAGAATSFAGSAMGTSLGLSQAGALIEGGMVTALDAALPAITATGNAFIGLAAAMPYVAAFVAVAYMAYKIFGGNKGGPKLQGYGGAGIDESGNVTASDTVGPGDRGFQSTNAGREMAEVWSKGVMQNTKDFMISIGKSLTDSVKVGFGFQMDNPKGDAPTEGNAIVKKNGQVMYTSDTGSAPKGDDEAWQKWLAEEAGRTMLATLKAQDDLPKNVAAYFETIAWDAIKTLSPEEVSQKLDFAKVLSYIDINNAKLTKLFGESIYDITENGLKAMQVTGETYTQTMERLTTTFDITNRVAKITGVSIEKAFDKVGLAGYDMRNSLIKAAGGLEAFTNKFNFYFENFYSESARGAMAMSDAQEVVTTAFAAMGREIPTTREDFNALMTEFMSMGAAGQSLVAQLLEVAPAFDYIHDAIEGALSAIESALDSIQQKAGDFRTQILDDTQSDEDRWKRIKGQVDSNVDVLDTISNISDEDLGALSVADIVKKTTDVQKNTEAAIGGVQKLWDSLSEDEKKIRGPEFIKWIDTIESNSATILARLGQAAIAKGGEVDENGVPVTAPKTPETTDELLAGLPESLATKLDASFATGADLIATKIQGVFDGFATTLADAMYSTGGVTGTTAGLGGPLPELGGDTPDARLAQSLQVADAIREQARSDQEEILGQQRSILESLAAKLLDAAKSMNDAAAGQQSAAVDFKQAAAAIPSKFEIKVEQESSSNNSIGV